MAEAKAKEGRTLRDVMRVVFRRKFHFLGAAAIFALAVACMSVGRPTIQAQMISGVMAIFGL